MTEQGEEVGPDGLTDTQRQRLLLSFQQGIGAKSGLTRLQLASMVLHYHKRPRSK